MLKGKKIYSFILKNKIVTICILFTVFTMLDTIPILLGLYPPKEGINGYVHLFGRLVLHSLVIFGLFIYDVLKTKIQSRIIRYLATFMITWSMLMIYLFVSNFASELHPDAYYYATRSYVFMYLLIGILVFIGSKAILFKESKRDSIL